MAKVCNQNGERTFAGTRGNGEVASTPVIRRTKAFDRVRLAKEREEILNEAITAQSRSQIEVLPAAVC
jgi:hypothetical protein